MGGDAEVEDPASVMSQHQEYVEDLEAHSRNSEEAYRYQVLHVILQEGPPSLRWRLPVTNHVLAHAGLADVHTEFEHFAVNPGGAPGRVRSAHQTDQIAYVFRNRRTPGLAMPDLPGPKKRRKAFSVPSDHSLGLDDDECGAPFSPHSYSQAQRSRSSGVNFGFFTERCRTPNWCRSARFSTWRAARVLKTDDRATTSVVSIPSVRARKDRKSTRLNSSHTVISYAVFCLKKNIADPRTPLARHIAFTLDATTTDDRQAAVESTSQAACDHLPEDRGAMGGDATAIARPPTS